MDKTARIKAFLDIRKVNNTFVIEKSTDLFEKLVQNVKREYKSFHQSREPKITHLEIPFKGYEKSPLDAGSYTNQEFLSSFVNLKKDNELPFATSHEIQRKNDGKAEVIFPSQKILRTSYFVNSAFTSESFYQLQRQHKIWWMRFGVSPGKYSISDQKSDNFLKFVTIKSNLEQSPLNIEKISCFSLKDCVDDKSVLADFKSRLPNRKKEVVPDVIEAVVDVQVAAFALLLDAVHLSEYYTAFHRRSAPYQLAVIAEGSSKDLNDLARFIELLVQETDPRIKVLRKSKKDFETLDSIGVPYSIILDDKALESGLFQLRSRITSLSETIHLSDVNGYLIKIFDAI